MSQEDIAVLLRAFGGLEQVVKDAVNDLVDHEVRLRRIEEHNSFSFGEIGTFVAKLLALTLTIVLLAEKGVL